MVAIVSGDSLGLSLTSLATLGQGGTGGIAGTGRNGELAYVNIANGNLVLQDQDDYLAARGSDIDSVRTYNSQGLLLNGSPDSWAVGSTRQRILGSGGAPTQSSTLVRVDRDGAQASYAWNTTKGLFASGAGAGAHDTLEWDAATSQYMWTDGDSGLVERYDSNGRLSNSRDADGNTLAYEYNGDGRLATVSSANGETVSYAYSDGNLAQIHTRLGNGSTLDKISYDYDDSRRLVTATVDLGSEYGSYSTRYAYDGTSHRIASVSQDDGTSLAFTYVQVNGQYRIETVTDRLLQVTSYSYDTANRQTTVIDPVGLATVYQYDAQGQLQRVQTGSVPAGAGAVATKLITVQVPQLAVALNTDAEGSSWLSWTSPPADTDVLWRYRPQGGTPSQWTTIAAIESADGTQGVQLPTGAGGVFEYELLQTPAGSTVPSGRALGTFRVGFVGEGHTEVKAIPVQSVAVQIAAGATADSSRMSWPAPAAGTVVTWRYRPAGDLGSEWSSLAVQTASGLQLVELAGIAVGNYDFELVHTAAGLPVAHATGVLTLSPEGPGYTVADAAVHPVRVELGAGGLPQLSWALPAAGTASSLKYMDATGVWRTLAVHDDEGSARQIASLAGVAAGSYRYQLAQSGATTAMVLGTAQILPTVPATSETQQLPIAVLPVTSVGGISWPAATDGATTAFRYRVTGTTTWRLYNNNVSNSNGVQTIGVASLPERLKWVEFEVLRTPAGGAPTAHALGMYYTSGSGNPSVKLGQVGRNEGGDYVIVGPAPEIRAVQVPVPASIVVREVGVAVAPGLSASGQPQLSWDVPVSGTTSTLMYRSSSYGSWRSLTITKDAASGKQLASLAGLAQGSYDFELVQAGTSGVRVTGTVNIAALVAAHTETQQVSVTVLPVTVDNSITWPAAVDGATTAFRWRRVNATEWTTYTGSFNYSGDFKKISRSDLQSDEWIEFEVVQTPAGGGAPTAHATGMYYYAGRRSTPIIQLGQVEREGGSLSIAGPTLTSRERQVSVPAATPAPILLASNTVEVAGITPLPVATTNTAAMREVSVWVSPPLQVVELAPTAVSTAQVEVQYYAINAAVQGLRQVRSFAYNQYGDVIAVTDAAGKAVSYEYDGAGNQTLERDAAGNTVSRVYNAANRLATETTYLVADADGAGAGQPSGAMTARYIHDPANAGRLRFAISAEGRVTEYRYNGYGQRSSVLVYAAASYAGAGFAYADLSHWSTHHASEGVSRSDMAYDVRGLLTTVTAYAALDASLNGLPLGQAVTRYIHDAGGRLLRVIDADNGETSYTYDALGRVRSSTDALSQTTLTSYDDTGNRSTVTLANGLATTSAYDRAGRLISQLRSSAAAANLGLTRYAYDAAGRLLMSTDPTGVRSFVLYDSQGRKVAEVDGDGSLTELRYDDADRLSRTIHYATPVDLARLVDAQGRPRNPALADIRPLEGLADRSSWRTYDAAGRLRHAVDAEGAVTEYSYDGASRLIGNRQYATRLAGTALLGDKPLPAAIAVAALPDQDRISRNFHDDDGLLLATLDAEGYLQERRYDGSGRLVQTIAYATATDATLRAAGTLDQLRPASAEAADVITVELYDARGQLAGQIDAEGYLTEYRYDSAGRQTGSTRYATRVSGDYGPASSLASLRPTASNAQDQVSGSRYDALGRLVEQTSPEGTVSRHLYDAAGHRIQTLLAVDTDAARTQAVRYDLQGRVLAELGGEGAKLLAAGQTDAQVNAIWADWATFHTYDAAGRRTSSTDTTGFKTLFFYDADHRLTHTVNALGEVSEATYDALGNRTADIRYATAISLAGLIGSQAGGLVNDALRSAIAAVRSEAKDSAVRFAYDRSGRLTSSKEAMGSITRFTRNAFGEAVLRTLDAGTAAAAVVTKFGHDRRGLETSRVADFGGLNVFTQSSFDAFGRLVSSVDGNGNTRAQQRDRLGRVVSSTDPMNAARTTSYDAFSRVVSQTDALGHVTSYVYDAANRSMAITSAENITVTTRHDLLGQVVEVTDGRGVTTRHAYDANGQLVSATVDEVERERLAYDRAGRLLTKTDSNGAQTALAYDAAGRILTRTVDAGGLNLQTRYSYDALGRQLSVQDPDGAVTRFAYDLDGRLTRQTVDPAGLNLATAFSYDGRGNTLTVTSPGGTVTRYDYDKLDRRVAEVVDAVAGGLNLTRSYAYDANGNVTSAVDANGHRTRYVYDANDRLIFTLDAANRLQHTRYDAEGRLQRHTRYASYVAMAESNPTLVQVQARVDALAPNQADAWEHHLYDQDGRRTATVNAMGEVVAYIHDAGGNVVQRTAFASRLVAWQPGAPAAPAAHASDQWQRTHYDSLNRAIYRIDSGGAVETLQYDGNGNTVHRHAYAEQIVDPAAMTGHGLPPNSASDVQQRNTYDAANRLVRQVDGTGAVKTFRYDGNGNLTASLAYATRLADPGVEGLPAADPAHDAHLRITYDKAGRRIATATAQGLAGGNLMWAVKRQAYDANGNVVSRTDHAQALSSQTLAANASQADVASWIATTAASPALDRLERMAYDKADRLVFQADPVNTLTRLVYDAAGNAVQRTLYANRLNLTGTFSAAAVASALQASASDRVTRTVFDAGQRAVYEIDAVGAVSERQFDAVGNLLAVRGYAAVVSIPTASATPGLAATAVLLKPDATHDRLARQVYDGAGRPIFSVDAAGFVTRSSYDAQGRLTATVRYETALAPATVMSQAAITGALAAQPVTAHDGDRITTFTHDNAGHLTASTDALGKTERYEYDGLGRKTAFINKLDARWTYAYDATGRLVTETTPLVDVTSVQIDSAGNPSSTTIQTASVTRLTYDALGNLASRIEAWGQPDQRTTEYAYDAAGRQVKTILPEALVHGAIAPVQRVVTVTYDALGNAVSNRDAAGNYSYKVYDNVGRPRWDIDAMGHITGYVHDSFGNVTRLTRYADAMSTGSAGTAGPTPSAVESFVNGLDPSGIRVIATQYDALGRAVKVVEPQAYAFDGNLSSGAYFTAGKATSKVYNAFAEVLSQSVHGERADGTPVEIRSNYTHVTGKTYHRYNALGQEIARLAVVSSDTTFPFREQAFLTTFTYDDAGNRLSQMEHATAVALSSANWSAKAGMAYVAPAGAGADRLTRYTYDLNGNKTSEALVGIQFSGGSDGVVVTSVTGDAVTRYGYDALGQLNVSTDALGTGTYTYRDALGRVTAVATTSLAKTRTHVAQLYLALLNRAPESSALDYLSANGQTVAEMALDVYRSPEASDLRADWVDVDAGLIQQVFSSLLGRDAEAGAVAFWKATMTGQGDADRAKLVTDIIRGVAEGMNADTVVMNSRVSASLVSPSKAAVDQAGVLAQRRWDIAKLYVGMFGRAPDPAGLAFYANEATPVDAMALAFWKSPEGLLHYPRTLERSEIVTRLYQNVFGAAPSPAAMAAWTQKLIASPGDAMGSFLTSLINSLTPSFDNGRSLRFFSNKVSAGLAESLDSSASATPLTTLQLDIHGNTVVKTDYAQGALAANQGGYKKAASGLDRRSHTQYDSAGRAVRAVDAEGHSAFTSYDIHGNTVREWRTVTDAAGVARTAFQHRTYDALGRVVETQEQNAAHQLAYNAFGELTRRSVNGEPFEYYDYDNAGHLWRTNSGDGVDKVFLLDVQGRQTAEIRSAVVDLRSFSSAAAVVPAGNLVRTDTRYDMLGNAVEQTRPIQFASDIHAATAAATLQPAFANVAVRSRDGTSTTIAVNWMSLAGLGGGDIKIHVEYLAWANGSGAHESDDGSSQGGGGSGWPPPDETVPSPVSPVPGLESHSSTKVIGADVGLGGTAELVLSGALLERITRVEIWKRDIRGEWRPLVDQLAPAVSNGLSPAAGPGALGSLLRIDAPADLETKVILEYQVAGASGFTIVPESQLLNFGDALLYDTSILDDGNYAYRVLHKKSAEAAAVVTDQGVFTAVQPQTRTQIAQLYVALLNRAPDVEGMDFYLRRMQVGNEALGAIAQSFYTSNESRQVYGNSGARVFVKDFYQKVLGITVELDNTESASYDFVAGNWADQLAALPNSNWGGTIAQMVSSVTGYAGQDAARTNGQKLFNNKVAVGLVYGVEGGGYTDAEAKSLIAQVKVDDASQLLSLQKARVALHRRQITALHVALLKRAPDKTELSGYVASLQAGTSSLAQIAQSIYSAAEAKGAQLYWSATGAALSDTDFVKQFYSVAMARSTVTSAQVANGVGRLAAGSTRGQLVIDLIDDAINYRGTDNDRFTMRQLFTNKVAVGLTYSFDVGGTDRATATALIAGVTAAATAEQAGAAAVAALQAVAAAAGPIPLTNAANATPLESLRQQVAQLYVAVLNRAPDITGLTTWVAAVKGGMSLAQVAFNLYGSAEGQQLLGGIGDTEFVKRLYKNAFGRDLTSAEAAVWAERVDDSSRQAVAVAMVDEIVGYDGATASWLAMRNLFNNKTAVGLAYSLNMGGGGSVATAQQIVAKVTATDTSAAIAYAVAAVTAVAAAAAGAIASTTQTAATKAGADLVIASNAATKTTAAAAAASFAESRPTTAASDRYTSIARLYQAALGRTTTPYDELHWWYTQGVTIEQMAQSMLGSPEALAIYPQSLSNAAYVSQIYLTVLGREVDSAGLATWTAELNSGKTRGQVLVYIVTGFTGYAGSSSDEQKLKAAFELKTANLLAGAKAGATAAGQTTVAGHLQTAFVKVDADHKSATARAEALIAAVATSSEATTTAAQQYTQIMQLYIGVLGRAGSLADLAYYDTEHLQAGRTIYQIAQSFLDSPEGRVAYPTGLSKRDFVATVYTKVFQREIDAAGETYWVGKLTSGQSRGQVLLDMIAGLMGYTGLDAKEHAAKKAFREKVSDQLTDVNTAAQAAATGPAAYAAVVKVASAEARQAAVAADASAQAAAANPAAQNRLQIVRWHTLLFNRGPDLATLNTLAAQLQGGTAAVQIVTVLLGSAEGLALYPTSQTPGTFISKLFQTSLGRNATSAEATKWSSKTKQQAVVDIAAWCAFYDTTGTADTPAIDGGALAAQHLLNDKVLVSLAGLMAAAKSIESIALEAARIMGGTVPRPVDVLVHLAWSASTVGAAPLVGVAPKVARTFDRWGNVLATSDPRNSAWTTRYTYNAWNQVLVETDANKAETRYFYDQIGRNVAVRDAMGNLNGLSYDAAGNLMAERQAGGGVVHHRSDAFGQNVLTRQANGAITAFGYDQLGRLASTTRAVGLGVHVYKTVDPGTDAAKTILDLPAGSSAGDLPPELVETYRYDELGRRIATANGAGKTRTDYDLSGNVTGTTDVWGRRTSFTYDKYGQKTTETQADGKVIRWGFDAWGRIRYQMDEGTTATSTRTTSYDYNRLGQLKTQRTARQDLAYTYDESSGLLLKIEDKSRNDGVVHVTQYAYDAGGNRTREKTSWQRQGAEIDIAQDNHLSYDKLGRVTEIADGRYNVTYEYDANGNRTHVRTTYQTPTWAQTSPQTTGLTGQDTPTVVDSWNTYDAMNRQVIVDGKRVAAPAGAPLAYTIEIGHHDNGDPLGQQIAYDSSGNRVMVRQYGVQLVGTASSIPTYPAGGGENNAEGEAGHYDWIQWTDKPGYVTESYNYDAAGRLTGTWRDGLNVEVNRYDIAGRVAQRGPSVGLPMPDSLRDTLLAAGISPDTQINGYNQYGQQQTVRDSHGNVKSQMAIQQDELGRTVKTVLDVRGSSGYVSTNVYTFHEFDRTKVASTTGTRGSKVATTTNVYDANGHMVEVLSTGEKTTANARKLLNDSSGRVLRKLQEGHTTHTLIANGEVIGSSSDSRAPVTGTFGSSFVPTNDASLTGGPQAYTVLAGDTLQSIAKAVWGNADLWYVLAEANSTSAVTAGEVIVIPAKPNTVYNDFNTFKPYNPSEAIGDTTPNVPLPKKKNNWFKQLLVVIIMVVVTIFTAGAAAAAMGAATTAGGATGAMALGGAAMTGGGMMTAAGAVGGSIAVSGAVGVASAALGAAVGSIASQGFAMAMGMQDKFNWKGVALSALSAGVTSGLGSVANGTLAGRGLEAVVGRAVLGNVITQGIGVVTGLQKKFDWRGVAASAAGAGVGQAVGEAVGGAAGSTDWSPFAKDLVTRSAAGFAGGLTAAVMRGGKISVQQVATDSFGNALAWSVADSSGQGSGAMAQLTDTFRQADSLAAQARAAGGGVQLAQNMSGGVLYDNGSPVESPQINLPQVDLFEPERTLPEVVVKARRDDWVNPFDGPDTVQWMMTGSTGGPMGVAVDQVQSAASSLNPNTQLVQHLRNNPGGGNVLQRAWNSPQVQNVAQRSGTGIVLNAAAGMIGDAFGGARGYNPVTNQYYGPADQQNAMWRTVSNIGLSVVPQGVAARAASAEVAGARVGGQSGAQSQPPLLLTYTPTTNTLSQIRRMPFPERWQAGEKYVQELYSSAGQQHFPVPSIQVAGEQILSTGGRFVDAPVPTVTGGTFAGEVKTYQAWRTINGQSVQQFVPLTEQIQQQVLKDVWLRRNVPGYDPRWIFLDAPPAADLSRYLTRHRIDHVIHQ